MGKVMLSFDKVSAHYGKIQALHEVSLHINQGEIVTLIGANGAGKTTLRVEFYSKAWHWRCYKAYCTCNNNSTS